MSLAGAPLVSVIIPTHDRRERLRIALASVLAQRDVDLEAIVIDDGSTDGSAAMVQAIGDPRIRVIRHPVSKGESAARNAGVALASGSWIAFLDDDDVWAPDKLARQLRAVRSTRRSWAYGGEVLVDDDLDVIGGSHPPAPETVVRDLSRYNAVPGSASNVLVSAAVLADVGPFDTELRRTPDWDMWLRLRQRGLPAAVDEPTVAICVHSGNVSRDMRIMFRELDVIAKRHGITVDRARHHRWAGWSSLAAGNRRDAFGHYVRAVAAGDPTSAGRALISIWPVPYRLATGRSLRSEAPDGDWTDRAAAWLTPLRAGRG
jgi:glycosyltransferase involved in cell wall biosynthesis